MNKDEFKRLTIADQGMILLNEGKHITVLKTGDKLLNLYSVEDFFVEVYYSFISENIDKIEIVTDYSKIDKYIEDKQKEEKLHLN